MKLFVDDIRREPEGWVRVRTVTEAIRCLATQVVDEVSLDHDISCRFGLEEHSSGETFEPVAWYLTLMQRRPAVRIHTANPEGGMRMARILGMPYNNQIFNEENYK